MKSSNEAFKAFHPTITELSTDDPDHHKTQQQAIREKICRMHVLSKQVLVKCNECYASHGAYVEFAVAC